MNVHRSGLPGAGAGAGAETFGRLRLRRFTALLRSFETRSRPRLRRRNSGGGVSLRGEENLLRLQDVRGLRPGDLAAHEVTVRGAFRGELHLQDLRLDRSPRLPGVVAGLPGPGLPAPLGVLPRPVPLLVQLLLGTHGGVRHLSRQRGPAGAEGRAGLDGRGALVVHAQLQGGLPALRLRGQGATGGPPGGAGLPVPLLAEDAPVKGGGGHLLQVLLESPSPLHGAAVAASAALGGGGLVRQLLLQREDPVGPPVQALVDHLAEAAALVEEDVGGLADHVGVGHGAHAAVVKLLPRPVHCVLAEGCRWGRGGGKENIDQLKKRSD